MYQLSDAGESQEFQ